jgi:hypothetical protein
MALSFREWMSLVEAGEKWVSFSNATALIRQRLECSAGRAEAILKQARDSGEVRSFDAEGSLGVQVSYDDLIDWMGRTYPPEPAIRSQDSLAAQPTEWMRKTAEANAAKGSLAKRDAMIRDCRAETGCTKREAEAAYSSLPERLRTQRGPPKRQQGKPPKSG